MYNPEQTLYIRANSAVEAACLFLLNNPVKLTLMVEYGFGAQEIFTPSEVTKAYPELRDYIATGRMTEEEHLKLDALFIAAAALNRPTIGSGSVDLGIIKIGLVIIIGVIALIFNWSDFEWWYRITVPVMIIVLIGLFYHVAKQRRKIKQAISVGAENIHKTTR
jgi:hypothetical protein